MIIRQVASVLVIGAMQFAPGQFAPAPASAPPPLTPGATWTYRYTVTPVAAAPRVGTVTVTYGGPTTYRGQRYYYTEVSDTVTPDLVERDYYVWTGSDFRQAAVETHLGETVLEIVFDTPVPLDTEESLSGMAETFQNGTYQGDIPWHVTIAASGVVTVTVPAGTYVDATRRETTFEFGSIRQIRVADSSGFVDLRVEARHYVNGVLESTTLQELASGPVP